MSTTTVNPCVKKEEETSTRITVTTMKADPETTQETSLKPCVMKEEMQKNIIATETKGIASTANKGPTSERPLDRPRKFTRILAPLNLKLLLERLDAPRSSPPPTKSEFEHYRSRVSEMYNKTTTIVETSRLLLKDKAIEDRDYLTHYGQFYRLPEFEYGLARLQSDMIEGIRQMDFLPFEFWEIPKDVLMVTNNRRAIALAHFAGEWAKSARQSESMDGARARANEVGTSMVRSRIITREALGTLDPQGYAFVFSFATNGHQLFLTAHYASIKEEAIHKVSLGEQDIQYHHHKLVSRRLTSSFRDFVEGRRQLRNLQEMAAENAIALRNALIRSKQGIPDPTLPMPSDVTDHDKSNEEQRHNETGHTSKRRRDSPHICGNEDGPKTEPLDEECRRSKRPRDSSADCDIKEDPDDEPLDYKFRRSKRLRGQLAHCDIKVEADDEPLDTGLRSSSSLK